MMAVRTKSILLLLGLSAVSGVSVALRVLLVWLHVWKSASHIQECDAIDASYRAIHPDAFQFSNPFLHVATDAASIPLDFDDDRSSQHFEIAPNQTIGDAAIQFCGVSNDCSRLLPNIAPSVVQHLHSLGKVKTKHSQFNNLELWHPRPDSTVFMAVDDNQAVRSRMSVHCQAWDFHSSAASVHLQMTAHVSDQNETQTWPAKNVSEDLMCHQSDVGTECTIEYQVEALLLSHGTYTACCSIRDTEERAIREKCATFVVSDAKFKNPVIAAFRNSIIIPKIGKSSNAVP